MRRVVITGLGTVNALGLDVATSYPRILAGENGVTTLDRFDTTGITATIAAQVQWSPDECGFDVKDQRKLDPFTMWALMASDEALADAGFGDMRDLPEAARERFGSIVGTGIGGITGVLEQHDVMRDRGARRVTPHFIPRIMPNAVSGQVAIRHSPDEDEEMAVLPPDWEERGYGIDDDIMIMDSFFMEQQEM